MVINLEDSLTQAVSLAGALLIKGGILLHPTDTIYGLGCDALNPAALARLNAAKKRDPGKPLVILAGSLQTVGLYFNTDPVKEALKILWPGPFTVLLAPAGNYLTHLKGKNGKIAVRIPKDPFLGELLEQWRGLLISTSANLSGEAYRHEWGLLPPRLLEHADLCIRRKEYPCAQPSAVIEWKGDRWNILREGPDPLPVNPRLS
ncbi:L-threonylcarbamoyladenylate synthase [Fibrobacterota bacterium]